VTAAGRYRQPSGESATANAGGGPVARTEITALGVVRDGKNVPVTAETVRE
jgi:hypothetical protein